ncbi:MAG: SpoIIE family protein phosphatase, partial [Lentisphaerae bacterium]|nr:SpoIIE family protein phosphatase [Lentisphaerota bacterium]
YSELVPGWDYQTFLDHIVPKQRTAVDEKLRATFAAGTDATFECRIVRADGAIRWISVAGRYRRDVDGHPHVAGTTQDITERKQEERARRQSEKRYRLLAEENERLYRQQFEIAEILQNALLDIPAEMGPITVGHLYRSATETARVGGDFYDVFGVKERHIAVLIGDVAGHGIEAARTATLVKDVVHAFAHQTLRPAEVLRRANGLLVEKALPGFVTLLLSILDRETGACRYANAGHPQAILKRASGEIETLGLGAMPLGVDPRGAWKPADVEMRAGDLLLLYTDGVLEARRGRDFFGEKRLVRILKRKRISASTLPQQVLDEVLAFSGGTLTDDLAVLALSYAGQPVGND